MHDNSSHLPGTLRPHQRYENECGGPKLLTHARPKVVIWSIIEFTHRRIRNSGKTHRLNAHDEERGVFPNAWYCVQRFSVNVHSTGDQPRMGEKDPNRIERDCEEVSE